MGYPGQRVYDARTGHYKGTYSAPYGSNQSVIRTPKGETVRINSDKVTTNK